MTATCKGPGHAKRAKCGREVKCKGLCSAHEWQLSQAKGDVTALKPLLGPHGRRYDNPTRLELRNLPDEVLASLRALGETLPPTDKRETELENRAARWLVAAYRTGRLRLVGDFQPRRATPVKTERGNASTGRVDMRNVDLLDAVWLEELGEQLPAPDARSRNLALRAARHLVYAFHGFGVRLRRTRVPKT